MYNTKVIRDTNSINVKEIKGICFTFNHIMEHVRRQSDDDVEGSVLYGTSSHSADTPGWDQSHRSCQEQVLLVQLLSHTDDLCD